MAATTTTTTPAPILALDSASHAVREEQALLDALPYVDPLDPAEAAAAEAAIRQEVRVKGGRLAACLRLVCGRVGEGSALTALNGGTGRGRALTGGCRGG
jgi:transketolase C-terminal domain/subunit